MSDNTVKGRPKSYTPAQAKRVMQLAAQGMAQRKIAEMVGLGRASVQRLLAGRG